MKTKSSNLSDYLYSLPDHRIAKHPPKLRSQSKILIYRNNQIEHKEFSQVTKLVPNDSLIFMNNTRVISARMIFHKDTGARIEIFLTEPIAPYTEYQLAFETVRECTWKCMIGNAKKWKDDQLLTQKFDIEGQQIELTAKLIDRENSLIKFEWDSEISFSQIVEAVGNVPLPPYLNRQPEKDDKSRYQTVYSQWEGAVAAPTAGLHFTSDAIDRLIDNGNTVDYLTLHVSAGTFKPIKEEDYTKHPMHNERIIINRKNLSNILEAKNNVIAVGTTAMRTLESIYWYGCKLIQSPEASFKIDKMDPYNQETLTLPSTEESIAAILQKMDSEQTDILRGETEIFIFPGYEFKICSGLFTNFHMPGSTLILLVAAFVGEKWKEIYDSALTHDYRFLSYGDTSLLLP